MSLRPCPSPPAAVAGSSASPSYPDEDRRPTSSRELLGFYAYQCAIEVVVIAGVGSFLPITLEELARGKAVLQSDPSKPCIASSSVAQQPRAAHPSPHQQQCVVRFFGFDVNTASFAMYTFSISVLLQAILVITMSGAADHGHYRKTLLLIFSVTGAFSLMLFLALTSTTYALGSLCAIVANICVGASMVLLNAYLPLLVRWHPSVVRRQAVENEHEQPLLASAPAPAPDHNHDPKDMSELQLATRISSNGYGFGYLAALVFQLFCIAIIIAVGSTGFALRLVLFAIGAWWLAVSVPVAYCLRTRPGPPLVHGGSKSSSGLVTCAGYMTYSWKKLAETMLRARQSKDVLLFLAAWFLISDAIATVSGTAILFAKTTLGMSPAALSMIGVTMTVFGVVGAFSCNRLGRYLDWTPTRTLIACICLFETVPLYGLLAYIPAIRRLGVLGLQQPWELYVLAAVYGLVLGGVGSFSRALYGELIPKGSEAAFYALFAVTDKGSSVVGPTIVGMITDATGEIRPGFIFLACLIVMPLVPLSYVDVERGKRQARRA